MSWQYCRIGIDKYMYSLKISLIFTHFRRLSVAPPPKVPFLNINQYVSVRLEALLQTPTIFFAHDFIDGHILIKELLQGSVPTAILDCTCLFLDPVCTHM